MVLLMYAQQMTYSSNGPHSVMDTTRPKSTLNDLEATTLAKNEVADWDADVLESKVSVSMGSIIVAIYTQHSFYCDSLGVCWYENDGLLAIDVLVLGV